MLTRLHSRNALQFRIALLAGVVFGFLLQRGGVTRYGVIIGQLLLSDFTVVKVMLTAVIVGTIGVHALRDAGLAQLHPKSGSVGTNIPGPLIFGIGFGLLGYCPGTGIGAVGQGSMDALIGGVGGMLIGSGIYAAVYPRLKQSLLEKGSIGDITIPRLLKINHWAVIVPFVILAVLALYALERAGL